MLIRPHDADTDEHWRRILRAESFGQLILPGRGRRFPVVVPTPYLYEGGESLWIHLQRSNPAWEALAESPDALFCVAAAQVFVPSEWNANPSAPVQHGVPTAFYAAVQLECVARAVDDPDELADVLVRQTARLQPEGGHAPIRSGALPYGPMLQAIRGLELRIEAVRSKRKFAGNRAPQQRRRIAERLAARGGPGDLAARAEILTDLG